MPKYNGKKRNNGNGKGDANDGSPNVPEIPQTGEVNEPRCNVCKSPYRRAIDRLIALGVPYAEIQRIFEIDRRSVASHRDKHLNMEEARVRFVMEQQGEMVQQNIEDGLTGKALRRTYLNIAVEKAFEALLTGDMEVEPKDALNIIEKLDRLDTADESSLLEAYRIQFTAFMQAIKEIIPEDLQVSLVARVKELTGDEVPQLPSGE